MNERILIVEDDPAISRLIDTNLMLSGYQTFCAMDGRQAVEVVQAQCFDLALCDIMLPELDGFELLPYAGFRVQYKECKNSRQEYCGCPAHDIGCRNRLIYIVVSMYQ